VRDGLDAVLQLVQLLLEHLLTRILRLQRRTNARRLLEAVQRLAKVAVLLVQMAEPLECPRHLRVVCMEAVHIRLPRRLKVLAGLGVVAARLRATRAEAATRGARRCGLVAPLDGEVA
jgi:hypothetical protein